MSFTTKRREFASALATVPDVVGYAHRPTTAAPGDAWPLLGPLDRAGGTAFNATWRVRVVLPQDEEAASDWLDEHWAPLFYALAPHGYVSRAVPVMLAAAGGELYALEITLTAEE